MVRVSPLAWLSTYLPMFVYYIAPIILLLFFFIKKRNLIWLTLPISMTLDIIAFWGVLTYYETQGLIKLSIAFHLIFIGIVIKIITLKRWDKPLREQLTLFFQKSKKIIIAFGVILGVIVCVYATHCILLYTSDTYNQVFDKEAFSNLIEIDEKQVENMDLLYWEFAEKIKTTDPKITNVFSHADKSFFRKLIYDGSYLKNPSPPDGSSYVIRVKVNNSANISYDIGFIFFQHIEGGDRFLVYYKGTSFHVKSPQLWKIIKEVTN